MTIVEAQPFIKELIEADEYFDDFKNEDGDAVLSDDLLPATKNIDTEDETALLERGVSITMYIDDGQNVGDFGEVLEDTALIVGVAENAVVNRGENGTGKKALEVTQRIKQVTSEGIYEHGDGETLKYERFQRGNLDNGLLEYFIIFTLKTNEI